MFIFVAKKKESRVFENLGLNSCLGVFSGSCPMIPNSFKVSRDATSVGHLEKKNSIQCMQLIKFVTMKLRFFSGNLRFLGWGPAISFIGSRFY